LALAPDELNIELAQTLIDLGRHSDLERLVKAIPGPRWQQLFTAMAARRFEDAADVADVMVTPPWAASLRHRAAQQLAE